MIKSNQKSVFYTFIKAISSVLECDCIIGPYSMLIKMGLPSTESLDSFINDLSKFGRTNTQIVFSTLISLMVYQFWNVYHALLLK
ncbi:Lrp/AsnC ligand binding domain-containing protein [Enterococcus faecium]|uniref:Lrp/AsnC ligand binding domain-containing protein n=1 Tax=Enterococcus faecium TaxID=1352 RepID=UPI001A7EF688|nr:Lrp/AsnC ligand binding domain-containing protein [Enterococcus faecium]MDH2797714.1 Lrp/AsnC ligand binding domain-containing protein [Enterococcus faecium]MDH2856736.1 Lrp/AsnC ligand binding domain-containing protein [Enterococcus faecium]